MTKRKETCDETCEGTLDLLQEPLYTNDYVVYNVGEATHLYLAKITGWTAKRVRVNKLNKDLSASDFHILIDPTNGRLVKVPFLNLAKLRMGFKHELKPKSKLADKNGP